MVTKYQVRRYFNGEFASVATTHLALSAAEKAAARLNRLMSEGWSARIYLGSTRVDA